MSIPTSSTSYPKPILRMPFTWLWAVASLGLAVHGAAQSVAPSRPSTPLTPRAVQRTSAEDATATSGDSSGTGSPIVLGHFRLIPQLTLRYMHADDLPFGTGTGVDSEIFTFAPALTAELGENWIFNYAPSWTNYSAQQLRDSVNHSVTLNGARTVGNWTLQLSEGYQKSFDILAETAEQTKQEAWSTLVSAARPLGNRSKYEGTVSFNSRLADSALYSDTKTWATQQWFRTQLTPKINLGLGVDLGYVEITNAWDNKYIQYLGNLTWNATEKIRFSLQGGLDKRTTEAPGAASRNDPSLTLSLDYRPLENTRISLSSFRTTTNSYFENALRKNKGWNVGLNQRLLEKLNLSLLYSRQTSDYGSLGAITVVDGRSDDVESFNANLSVQLFQKWTLSAVYLHSKNDALSTLSSTNFSYSTSQYGLELSGRF